MLKTLPNTKNLHEKCPAGVGTVKEERPVGAGAAKVGALPGRFGDTTQPTRLADIAIRSLNAWPGRSRRGSQPRDSLRRRGGEGADDRVRLGAVAVEFRLEKGAEEEGVSRELGDTDLPAVVEAAEP